MADLEKHKGQWWLDWDEVNWPVNTAKRSLNPKCHLEYQEMRGGWLATLFTRPGSATEMIVSLKNYWTVALNVGRHLTILTKLCYESSTVNTFQTNYY